MPPAGGRSLRRPEVPDPTRTPIRAFTTIAFLAVGPAARAQFAVTLASDPVAVQVVP